MTALVERDPFANIPAATADDIPMETGLTSRNRTTDRVNTLANARITTPRLRDHLADLADRWGLDLSQPLPGEMMERLCRETGKKVNTVKCQLQRLRKDRGIIIRPETTGAPLHTENLHPDSHMGKVAAAGAALGIDLRRPVTAEDAARLAQTSGLRETQVTSAASGLRRRTSEAAKAGLTRGTADQVMAAAARLGLDLDAPLSAEAKAALEIEAGLTPLQTRDALKTVRDRQKRGPAMAPLAPEALPKAGLDHARGVALAVAESLFIEAENGAEGKADLLLAAAGLLLEVLR